MENIICPSCKAGITPYYEDFSFDYAGTHCTHGQSGTHHCGGEFCCPECDVILDYEPDDYTDYEHGEK